jgi:hypothetical protein
MIKSEKTFRNFDPKNEKYLKIVKNFFTTYAWGQEGCPFELEYPYLDVPTMIKDKLISNLLGVQF